MSRGTCNLQTLKLLQAVVKIILKRLRPCSCSNMSHNIQDLLLSHRSYESLWDISRNTHRNGQMSSGIMPVSEDCAVKYVNNCSIIVTSKVAKLDLVQLEDNLEVILYF